MTLQLTKKHSFDTVFDSQKVFRIILEAVSNPARVLNIAKAANKLFGDFPEILSLAMTLLDNETGFYIYGNYKNVSVESPVDTVLETAVEQLEKDIASLTLARKVEATAADFIFVCDPSSTKEAIEQAKCGTLIDPHKSATIVIQNDEELKCNLTLSGPGIDGVIKVFVSQAVKDALFYRDAQNYEYPEGIDLIFISKTGDLFAIPRLIKVVQ
ncbi:MAG: phosphonate C-P lyase system protein PhnH [Ruminococcaceae bacterium]|nr:phosphonate C-P lyase system protein PhnH [Oscillospiraceae bacterium]